MPPKARICRQSHGLCKHVTQYIVCMQETEEAEDSIEPQPEQESRKAGLLSKAFRPSLGSRQMSLHNLLDQAPISEGQQVCMAYTCLPGCPYFQAMSCRFE